MNTAWLVPHYDPLTVLLSVGMAIYAAYVALDLTRRVRDSDRTLARAWLLGGSLAMGTGIWSMHFVGMMAMRLPMQLGYTPGLTALSWLAAVAVSGTALALATVRHCSWRTVAGGALCMGAGISAMHYIGMAALVMQPEVVWDLAWVAVSVVIAVAASATALMIFRIGMGSGERRVLRQLGAAVVMGLAIAGMHYAGMVAAQVPAGALCLSAGSLSGNTLGSVIAGGSLLILTMTLLTSLVDAHLQQRTQRLAGSLRKAEQRLQHVALFDPLTQLASRLAFEDRLTHAMTLCERRGERAAVFFINLDGFKPINDSWGRRAGDSVLVEMAARLRQVAAASDTAARLAGDEFLLLHEQAGDSAVLAQFAQRLLEAFTEPVTVGQHAMQLSCSIGISVYPGDGAGDKLVGNAEAAMNAAKRAGGGSYRFFEASMDAGVRELVELQQELRRGLAGQEFELYYQPKLHGSSGQITGVEALVRWNHPRRGLLAPGVFIPVAERFGLIGLLGQWILEEACRQLQAWAAQGVMMRVAINLSMHQLRQDDLAERIASAIQRHGLDPSLLTFEITESAAMENPEATLRTFKRIAAIGATLSIDDFGTGYSSLSHLRQLPAKQLKIDRSFVKDLETSGDARAIVDAVVQLAHAMGLRVVAEGVETEGQHHILRTFACDELQGFLFARPMPADKLTLWILEDRHSSRPLEFRPSIYGEPALLPVEH
ncbi:putative bifunctional diguanylate cyclase/phosphodiesterase [Eleftheria terrae]|uniref:putative bifunctional diguanylate cyclase/phosphodiesterase n=1 Tax=Eleftheria terrae TaxID=1597781 RepID=UPI00263B1014|nr:EAL domain-containing protein [Eleftheria terrae]WKB51809.1 EAL domain-containing protein [Eleftheria terrae]